MTQKTAAGEEPTVNRADPRTGPEEGGRGRLESPRIVGVSTAFPPRYYDQETLTAAIQEEWGEESRISNRLMSLHRNVRVGGRHLALDIPEYARLTSMKSAHEAFVRAATDLGGKRSWRRWMRRISSRGTWITSSSFRSRDSRPHPSMRGS